MGQGRWFITKMNQECCWYQIPGGVWDDWRAIGSPARDDAGAAGWRDLGLSGTGWDWHAAGRCHGLHRPGGEACQAGVSVKRTSPK